MAPSAATEIDSSSPDAEVAPSSYANAGIETPNASTNASKKDTRIERMFFTFIMNLSSHDTKKLAQCNKPDEQYEATLRVMNENNMRTYVILLQQGSDRGW